MKQEKSWLVRLLASLSLISPRSGKIYTTCKDTAIRLAESCDLVSVAYLKCLYARLETVKSSMQFVVVAVVAAAATTTGVSGDETSHQDGKMLSKETIDGAASSSTSALPVTAVQSSSQQQNNDVQMRDTTTNGCIESITTTTTTKTDEIDQEDEDEANEEEDSIYDTKPIWVNLEPSRETTDEHATAAATDNGDLKSNDNKSRLGDVKQSWEVDEDPVRYSETCRDIYEFAKLVAFLGEIMCSSSACRQQIVSHLKVNLDYLDLKSKYRKKN